jgi:hypothetical protein
VEEATSTSAEAGSPDSNPRALAKVDIYWREVHEGVGGAKGPRDSAIGENNDQMVNHSVMEARR